MGPNGRPLAEITSATVEVLPVKGSKLTIHSVSHSVNDLERGVEDATPMGDQRFTAKTLL